MTVGRRRPPPLPTVRDILRIYNINATPKLSQNFLLDPRQLDRIAGLASPQGKCLVEVGPGPGGITRSLLGQGAAKCVVIEKDSRFLPALQLLNDVSCGRLDIHIGDVMTFNMVNLFPDRVRSDWDGPHPNVEVIGNLPFNVSTPLLIRWLRAISLRDSVWRYGRVPLTLTFQLEVAQRMVAPPGNPIRSRLSVVCQNWTRVNHKFTIPGGAFTPKPEVDVAVVTMYPLIEPYIKQSFPLVNKVVTNIFHGKRKKLYNTLPSLFPKPLSLLSDVIFEETGLSPMKRAIDLDMNDWSRLCDSYARIIQVNPSLAKYKSRVEDPHVEVFDHYEAEEHNHSPALNENVK